MTLPASGQARFKQGSPQFLDYTPGSAVEAGEVLVVGDLVLIAHNAIAANKLGALASGGGVYDMVGDGVIAKGKKVYWDATNDKATETAGSNKILGFVGSGASDDCDGDGERVRVVHRPQG